MPQHGARGVLAGEGEPLRLEGRNLAEQGGYVEGVARQLVIVADVVLGEVGEADAVAGQLREFQAMDPKSRGSIWSMAALPFRGLLDPAALALFAPGPGAGTVDLGEWLTGGTIYVIGEESEASPLRAPLAALVDALTRTAKTAAAGRPAGRLDPPVGLFLDELANVAPLTEIPGLMSVAGGQGLFVVAVLQNLAQAEERFGATGARKLVGAARVKILLSS